MRSIVSLDASPPHRVQKSGVRTAAHITLQLHLAVCGIWANEDQELAGVRFGLRALTRTLVVFQDCLSHPSLGVVLRRVLPSIKWVRLQPAGRSLVI